jgi:nucleotide-binding universal stress UspA family protein
MLGSVADALARTLTVPILLLRPSKTAHGPRVGPLNFGRILIPLDGSEFAQQVIEEAVDVGWPVGARYTLLQVLTPPYPPVYDPVRKDDAEFQLLQVQAREYLESVACKLRKNGLQVDTVVVTHMDTAAAIIQESIACEADLIAMTVHGRSGWQRLLMGSVAERVLHDAQLPLLILKGTNAEVTEAAATQTEPVAFGL